jgi:hypothetical protein
MTSCTAPVRIRAWTWPRLVAVGAVLITAAGLATLRLGSTGRCPRMPTGGGNPIGALAVFAPRAGDEQPWTPIDD